MTTIAVMNSTITKELLFKHFTGETSALQKQLIDEWASVRTNEEYYYKWLEEYENLHPEYRADVDQAIGNYQVFLAKSPVGSGHEAPEQEAVIVRSTRWGFWYGAIAASITLILIAFAVTQTDSWEYKLLATDYGETRTFRLSDGSDVTLNANSSLKIPRWGFGEASRRVFLEGEASFYVKHTAGHQKFIVQTAKQFEVEVLGTEFTVFTRNRGTRVILNKGKVQINLREGNATRKMVMKPGDLVTLDAKNHVEQKNTPQPEIHSAWQDHRYVFDQTTLQEIIYLLNENYGLTTEVANKELLSLTVSGTLTADSADHILELIETVLELRITQQDRKVLISQNNQ